MKTTAGKTKTPVTGERTIHIYREHDGRILANVEAPSLKEALKRYYERTLKGYGFTNPKHNGNTMTVTDKKKKPVIYVALETNQQHVLA